jgi:hypothetical protein
VLCAISASACCPTSESTRLTYVRSYLNTEGKDSIVLYVAHANASARHVYRMVGFHSLRGQFVRGVEPWLEIGFDRAHVKLGHW